MKDKNNKTIQIGDIVKIENSPIKTNNATYIVAQDGTSNFYSSTNLTLYKAVKHKEGYSLSRGKYSLCFYPLTSFSNKYKYTKEEMAKATIEIIKKNDPSKIEIVKNDDRFEHIEEGKEKDLYFYCKIATKEGREIEDISFLVSQQEKLQAFLSNVTLKTDEEIRIAKKCNTDIYYGSTKYEAVYRKEQEKTEKIEIIKIDEAIEDKEEEEKIEVAEVKATEKKEIVETEKIERKYYPINERLAKTAHNMGSFRDYKHNSTTENYKQAVDEVYNLVEEVSKKKPNRLNETLTLAERYARKYAEWLNKWNNIEMMCPSIMISGAGNFPVRKKEKQNRARDKHFKDLEYIKQNIKKIKNLLYGKEIIKSDDADAVEKLQEKLEKLQELQGTMKEANAYYRKNNTLQGFKGLKQENIDSINEFMQKNIYHNKPFASYTLTNNNAKIKATRSRLEQLQRIKENGNTEEITKDAEGKEIFKIVENTEIMRLQLLFDGKPSEEIRNVLKSHGFKWAPSQKAWQRQLTDNARYSLKRAKEKIEKIA